MINIESIFSSTAALLAEHLNYSSVWPENPSNFVAGNFPVTWTTKL